MIYTIAASYGQYSDHCVVDMYATADLDDARIVMFGLQESIIAAMDLITVAGHNAINCNEAIWNVASGAHWDGQVRLAILSMELGVVSDGTTFIESVLAESSYERLYNRDVYGSVVDEAPCMSKYELLALPYEAKYGLSEGWK